MIGNIKDNKIVSSGIWYTLTNILLKGVGFLTMPIFSRILSVEEYGEFNIFSTWLSILMTISTLDLFITISRAVFDYGKKINTYMSNILLLGNIFTILFALVLTVLKKYNVFIIDINETYIPVMICYLFFYPAINIYQAKQRQLVKYKSVVIISLVITLSSVFFSFLGIKICANHLTGRIYGYILPQILVAVGIYAYMIKDGINFNKKDCIYALNIALPLIPHTLAGNVLGTCDQIVIRKFWGNEFVAYYSVAYTCSLIISILWQSLNQAISPWLYLKMNNREDLLIKRMTYYYIAVFFSIVGGLMLVAPEILLLFGGEKYLKAIFVMPPVIAGCAFQFAYSLYVNIEIYCKKTYYISKSTVMAAGINLGLNLLFIPGFGYIAAAYTTLIGYFFLYLFHYNMLKKIKRSYLYDNKYIAKMLLLVVIFMFVVNFLYLNNIIRYSILLIYIIFLICVFIKWKVITSLINCLSE